MKTSVLQERLRLVVGVVFSGSSHAAAVATHVEPSTLHRLLEGSVADPRMTTLRALAEGFGVPLGWLTGDMTTAEAQGRDSQLDESLWLLREYHGRRQREAWSHLPEPTRSRLTPVADSAISVGRVATNAATRLASVAALLQSFPESDPRRLNFEKRIAELETDLVEATVNIANPRRLDVAKKKPDSRK